MKTQNPIQVCSEICERCMNTELVEDEWLCQLDHNNCEVVMKQAYQEGYNRASQWLEYPKHKPTETGKYEVYRAGAKKQHYETWNGSRLAQLHKITITMEAPQSKGTHRIPKPTKGMRMKLDSMDKVFDYLPAELDLPERWITTTGYHSFIEGTIISNDVTWTLEPILDSGIWLDGRLDLPEPTEETILLLYFGKEFDVESFRYNDKEWRRTDYHDFNTPDDFVEPLRWMWISAPKQ